MPPKSQAKADKKKIAKAIEDKTFGLKNKSKSKKVQQYVKSVEQNLRSTSSMVQAEKNKQLRNATKEAEKQAELERKALFSDALLYGKKKNPDITGKNAPDAVPVDTKEKQIQITYEVFDHEEKTIEDIIEEKRAAFLKEGKQGTPVTAESLALWKEKRDKKRRDDDRRIVELEMIKKGKKKAFSVLSGRALYDYDETLFSDDVNAATRNEMNEDYDSQEYNREVSIEQLTNDIDEELFINQDDDELDDLTEKES